MSSNQDSTEPWDCISRISEDTPSLSSSWQDLGERPEEPESQTAETEGNQQSHEADTESDVGGFEAHKCRATTSKTHSEYVAFKSYCVYASAHSKSKDRRRIITLYV
ncbi:hypothetical protein ACKLNR_004570 [Fusarium oxysporum f. sp. zingiberi]